MGSHKMKGTTLDEVTSFHMAEAIFYVARIICSRSMNSVCFLVVSMVVVSIYIARSRVACPLKWQKRISLYLITVTKSTSIYLGSYSAQNLSRNGYPFFSDLEETAKQRCSMNALQCTQWALRINLHVLVEAPTQLRNLMTRSRRP